MFLVEVDEEEYGIKPMNCPGHVYLFGQGKKSYRDLPIRMAGLRDCTASSVRACSTG